MLLLVKVFCHGSGNGTRTQHLSKITLEAAMPCSAIPPDSPVTEGIEHSGGGVGGGA